MVQSFREAPRMGGVQDGEPVDDLRMIHRDVQAMLPPSRDRPQRGIGAERSDETADVVGEQVDAVGLEALRLR